MEILESQYNKLMSELNGIKLPAAFKNPSNNLFLDRSSAINAIISVFPALNKILVALGEKKEMVEVDKLVKRIKDPALTDEKLIEIVGEANQTFGEKSGLAQRIIMRKFEDINRI